MNEIGSILTPSLEKIANSLKHEAALIIDKGDSGTCIAKPIKNSMNAKIIKKFQRDIDVRLVL